MLHARIKSVKCAISGLGSSLPISLNDQKLLGKNFANPSGAVNPHCELPHNAAPSISVNPTEISVRTAKNNQT